MPEMFDEFKVIAERVYSEMRDLNRECAVLVIVEELLKVHSEAQTEMLNRVESRLADIGVARS